MYQAYVLKIKNTINIRQRGITGKQERGNKYVSPMALQKVKKKKNLVSGSQKRSTL